MKACFEGVTSSKQPKRRSTSVTPKANLAKDEFGAKLLGTRESLAEALIPFASLGSFSHDSRKREASHALRSRLPGRVKRNDE